MGWPISALGGVAFEFDCFHNVIGLAGAGIKNPRPFPAVGVLSKFALNATRPNGAAASDDDPVYHQDLQRFD